MIVERNDVDISPLFAWSREFKISVDDKDIPVFMRLLGDADMNRARVAALRCGANLRKKLRDLDSDERVVYIKDIEDMNIETLVAVISVFSMRDLQQTAIKKLTIKVPKEPRSDSKTEIQEKYQEEVDTYPQRRQEELRGLLEKEVEIFKESLEKESKETLYKKYVATMINELCEQEQLKEFKAWCAYLGSYKDEGLTEKLFSSYNDFSNLPPDLKIQFVIEYSKLELYGDDLKKLQQVTR